MQYIKLGRTNIEASRLGLGCMRLPKSSDPEKGFDLEASISLIRKAIDLGINYIDTAYVYSNSEWVLGHALKEGYREKVTLVTKIPIWKANKHEDLYDLLNEELERLQTDYVDILLIHNVGPTRFPLLDKLDVFSFIRNVTEKGLIKNIGFSFHGDRELFKKVVDAYDWDVCQIQLNFLDEKHQAGLEGLYYASEKGIPVIIMEPLRGGALVNDIPKEVSNLYDKFKVKRTPVEWAFRYLYNKPEVSVILSGMSNMQQLLDNVEIFDKAQTLSMDEDENDLINKVKEAYNNAFYVPCTGCEYCLPCKKGINIPEIFRMYNSMKLPDYQGHTRFQYKATMSEIGLDASACVECGSCEKKCPQDISIMKHLKEAHELLTQK